LYDVSIVGAGPVGNYLAYRLARLGYEVAVFEAKEAIGSQVCCTGIISRECHDLFSPSSNVVLREARSAKFIVPSGRYLRLAKNTVQAYIIDRAAFDIALAKRAQETGARYFLQSKVTDALREREGWQVEVSSAGQRQTLNSGALVIACGFGSSLPQQLGRGKIGNFLAGAQTEVNTGLDEVEIYFDQELAPGGFAWLVPTSMGRGLAGVICRHNARLCLEGLLSRFTAEDKVNSGEFDIRQGAIPLGTLPRTYAERLLVVGEAAGQVKPTTGGGIYFGLLCAEIAADNLHQGFASGDLSSSRLARYQKEWQARIGYELRLDYWAHKIYSKVTQGQIEHLFEAIRSSKIHEQFLNWEDFSFDYHGELIFRALRQPRLLAGIITPRLLFSSLGVPALVQLALRRNGKRANTTSAKERVS
jgi:digeranylgeranylglycerophospholipid reductase